MARIFISYGRPDKRTVKKLATYVTKHHTIWFDDHLKGGEQWWQRILEEIRACDIFLLVLSNDSIGSPYCQAEWVEAHRLRKQLIPVLVRANTTMPDGLGDLQYVNMEAGADDQTAQNDLDAAINYQLTQIGSTARARWTPETALPKFKVADDGLYSQLRGLREGSIAVGDVRDYLDTLYQGASVSNIIQRFKKLTLNQKLTAAGLAVAILTLIVTVIGEFDLTGGEDNDRNDNSTNIVQNPTNTPTVLAEPTSTSTILASDGTVDPSPTEDSSPTNTIAPPTPIATTQTPPTSGSITIFRDVSSWIVYVPVGDTPVSIEGLRFEVAEGSDPTTLGDYAPFEGVNFGGLTDPTCFVVYQVSFLTPQQCDEVNNNDFHSAQIALSDIFWYDTVRGQGLQVTVYLGNTELGSCPNNPDCEFALPVDN